jgi:hypothetical protein
MALKRLIQPIKEKYPKFIVCTFTHIYLNKRARNFNISFLRQVTKYIRITIYIVDKRGNTMATFKYPNILIPPALSRSQAILYNVTEQKRYSLNDEQTQYICNMFNFIVLERHLWICDCR